MRYDFDQLIDRRNSDSSKWNYYPEDVLPLWTADMDFRVAQPVIDALHARVDHGIFGYAREAEELREIIAARMAGLYSWEVRPEEILFEPGVVPAFNRACRVIVPTGGAVVVQPPVYPPILAAPRQNGLHARESVLVESSGGRYEVDWVSFEKAAAGAGLFILCNPHNPVGTAFRCDELERMAEICLAHGVVICSDEIHCDLVFRGFRHIPIASLGPDVARRTITLMAPSKTYNVPGLHCSMAIVRDPDLRRRMRTAESPHFPSVNALGLTAALAAYRSGDEWLGQVLEYLEANRNLVVEFVRTELPGIRTTTPEATYLAWLDCRAAGIPGHPYRFFLEKAKVGLSAGRNFSPGFEHFVRLNFACPRSRLLEALNRMKVALGGIRNP